MLQKRLDYGFNGYHVPFVPRAARSARRRGPVQKKVKDTQLCAFDLLATVAGEILLEGGTSHTTSPGTGLSNVQNVVMNEDGKVNPPLVFEHCDRGNIEADSSFLSLELGIHGLEQDNVKEVQGPTPDSYLSPTSVFPLTDCLEKNGSLEKIDLNTNLCCHSGEIESDSLGNKYGPDAHSIEGPEILDGKSPTLVSSNGSVKLTLGNDHYPCRDNNVNVVSRDDDENSSECIQPSTMKTTRFPTRIGDRRIRKLFGSKYRRIASKARDGDLFDIESLYRSKKTGYKSLRSQRIYPFKRKRFYHYNYCVKANATASGFGSVGVNGLSACVAGQGTTFLSRESNVKLRIKSFLVPELFIEMSETSTIGSLKRTVMEAVSALLGGGLHVGVRLQGKKLRDDNRTLGQSGICHDNIAESLGFCLEPNSISQVGAPVHSEENSLVLRTGVPQPVSRSPITTSLPAEHLVTNVGNFIESDHDSAPSPADFSVDRGVVSLHGRTPHALAVAHSRQKSERLDMSQRRIRRPFSVSEVESLVHAVEKLGTGRWRDVKIRGFDNVKHRTYVDLKDKWKTLVHTARIAPQQRRGQPVPQELLDRVLAAHAFWTQHQSKQELKQPPPTETCLPF